METKQFVRVVKLSVRCETCGHQAIVSAPCRGTRYPVLYCGECGDREPLIEPWRNIVTRPDRITGA
jgi:transcription elongation factor Elf1